MVHSGDTPRRKSISEALPCGHNIFLGGFAYTRHNGHSGPIAATGVSHESNAYPRPEGVLATSQSTAPISIATPSEHPPAFTSLRVLLAAALWGLSGTVAELLFQRRGFSPGWLVGVRMLTSGLLIVAYGLQARRRPQFLAPLKVPAVRGQLVIFTVVGLSLVQYSYFAAIQASNAATATLLQYLGPAFVIVYAVFRERKLPNRVQTFAVASALVGTWLLVSGGSVHVLSISPAALGWGLLSAVTLAFYTIYPGPLIKSWGTAPIIGWAMLLGGLVFMPLAPFWDTAGQHWSVATGLMVLFVVVFGTLIAFSLYLQSLKWVAPSTAVLLASAEPVAAAIAAMVWLHVHLSVPELIGGGLIVVTVTVMSAGEAPSRVPGGRRRA